MQGFVCLIGLVQSQALLYLLLGLVLAHLWCKTPHKIFIRLGHALSVRQQESRSLPGKVQTQRRSPEDDPPERPLPEGLPDPALSAPALLRQKGNRIHQSKTATHQEHYPQS